MFGMKLGTTKEIAYKFPLFSSIIFSLYPSAKKEASSKNFVPALGFYTLIIPGLPNWIIPVSYSLKPSLPPHFEFRVAPAISASRFHHFAVSELVSAPNCGLPCQTEVVM